MENKTFTLIGKFDDQITKKLRGINNSLDDLNKALKIFSKNSGNVKKGLDDVGDSFTRIGINASKSFERMTASLEYAGKSAGKVRDTVSQIGEGVRGLDRIGDSLENAARAAGRAGENVSEIGRSAGRANQQAEGLLSTLLKANALVNVGGAFSQGVNRAMGGSVQTAGKGFGLLQRLFKGAADDQMADIKAQAGVMGSMTMKGYKGSEAGGGVSFGEAGKFYKAIDRNVAEMIRTSAAPTAKVVELQRYTLDTLGPLMLAAEGVPKGSNIRKIDPKKVDAAAKRYGGFLEKVAILSQGTGSGVFQVAAGVEGLITRGKIDTTIDFFTDNVLLMKALEHEGFAGRNARTAKMMSSAISEEEKMQAVIRAFEKAQSSEATAAMAQSLTGTMQAFDDTIFNSSVGVLGMAVTFTEKEQKGVNSQLNKLYGYRIKSYEKELAGIKDKDSLRALQLKKDIADTKKTLATLTKKGEEQVTTPFLAFSLAFTNLISKLTEALAAIGPLWKDFVPSVLEFSFKFLEPLAVTLKNVASNMRLGKFSKAFSFGRIAGEFFKYIGNSLADLAKAITDPKGALNTVQNEFVKGFLDAFKEPGSLEKAKKGIQDAIWALFWKITSILASVALSPEFRPLLLAGVAIAFGPPFISAVITGLVPLAIMSLSSVFKGLAKKVLEKLASGKFLEKAIEKFRPTKYPSSPLPKAQQLSIPLGGFKPAQLGLPLESVTPKPMKPSSGASVAARVSQVGKNFVPYIGSKLSGPFTGMVSAGQRVLGFFKAFAPAGQRFMGFFKGIAGKLSIVGAIITSVISLFSGESLARSLAQGAGPLLGAALGAALFPFLGPLGPLIGGWIGSLEPVVSFLEGVFLGIGQVVNHVFSSLGDIGGVLVANLSDIWGVITSLFPALRGAGQGLDFLRIGLTITKMILFPLTATLDLISFILIKIRQGGLRLLEWMSTLPFMKGLLGGTKEITAKKIEADRSAERMWTNNANEHSWGVFTGADMAKASTVPKSLADVGIQANATSGVLGSTTAQQKAHLQGLKDSQAKSLAEQEKMRKSWSSIIVGSQSLLMKSANYLSTAISSAASKINAASIGLKGRGNTPGAMASGAYRGFVPGSSNRKMALGEAIASEMRNKPSGSHLVIANSSETVIPAAKGFTPGGPLTNLSSSLSRYIAPLASLGSMADELRRLRESSLFMGGGKGSLGAARALAAMFGLSLTSHVRPWDIGSYHQIGRAMDFSNSSGPTPQMMAFAQEMLKRYGSSLTELIYTPLGFSIKNGRQVPPLAAGAHYNHVHVAFGLGSGNPAFFSSQSDAIAWEKKMMPSTARVSSVTTNSSEGFGSYTLNSPITIYQQPGQDPEELANIVATRLNMAISELRNHYA